MSREQLFNKYKHVIAGMILDGMTHRTGAEKSLFIAQIFAKIESILAQIHQDMSPRSEVKNNDRVGAK
jgi:hypothetical protein